MKYMKMFFILKITVSINPFSLTIQHKMIDLIDFKLVTINRRNILDKEFELSYFRKCL